MIDTKDIRNRIESDFGENASEAYHLLNEAILKTEDLNHQRIIRCILFLAEGNSEKLKQMIQAATSDPRDVLFWAEYINRDGLKSSKRVRNFNHSFEDSEKNVEE